MKFPETNWALVRQLDNAETEVRSEALGKIWVAYGASLLAFARGEFRDKQPEDHEDILQSFYLRCWKNSGLAGAEEGEGQFRNYLTTAFRNFGKNWVRDEKAQKRRPPVLISTEELVEQYGEVAEPRAGEGGEGPFHRVYLKQAFELSMKVFEAACQSEKRKERFDAFAAYYVEPVAAGKRPSMGELALRLHRPEDSCERMLKSAYRQFRDIATEYLAKDCGKGAGPAADWTAMASTMLMS